MLEPLYLGVFQPVLRILVQGPSRPHYSVLVRGASKAAGVFYTLWTRGVCECGSALQRLCVKVSVSVYWMYRCVLSGRTVYKLWIRSGFFVFRDRWQYVIVCVYSIQFLVDFLMYECVNMGHHRVPSPVYSQPKLSKWPSMSHWHTPTCTPLSVT